MPDDGNPNVDAQDDTTNPVVSPDAQTEDTLTQKDFQRALNERLARERAKYADYDQLKAAAAKLKDLEDADKTAQQKAADDVAAAKAEAETARADVTRFRAAAAHGITGDDVDLIGTGTTEQVETRATRVGVLLSAERELAALKAKAVEDDKRTVGSRPAVREWQPGATPVSVNGGPTAKDRAAAQSRALGWTRAEPKN